MHATSRSTGVEQQLSRRVRRTTRRWGALVVLCLGFLMVQLDQTIVNVALPAIRAELHFDQGALAWVVNAYLIGFGGTLILAGRLGDLLGRQRMSLAGLTVFTLASVACGVSGTQALLIVARFVQGIGGAMITAVILGVIVTLFPEARERARALGVYSFVAAAGAALGLLLGGLLTETLSWHWIFFVNVPIGAVTVALTWFLVPADQGLGMAAGADVLGAVLLVAAVMLTVFVLISGTDTGWTTPGTLAAAALAIGSILGFVLRQLKARNPLVPAHSLSSPSVIGANITGTLLLAGLFGMFFLGALYLQRTLHYDPLQTGLALLPFAVLIGVMSMLVTDRIIAAIGFHIPLFVGFLLAATGMWLLSNAGSHAQYLRTLLPAFSLLGIGAGLAFPAVFGLALSTATGDDSGLISGLVNTSQQIGGAVGLAVLAGAATAITQAAAHQPPAAALLDGYAIAFQIGAGILIAGAVITVLFLALDRRPRP